MIFNLIEKWVCSSTFLCLRLFPYLNSGKVHGSLARAGKVKGQTPKVAKQEKKKQLVGRPKKRLQYNKRYMSYQNNIHLISHDLVGTSTLQLGLVVSVSSQTSSLSGSSDKLWTVSTHYLFPAEFECFAGTRI